MPADRRSARLGRSHERALLRQPFRHPTLIVKFYAARLRRDAAPMCGLSADARMSATYDSAGTVTGCLGVGRSQKLATGRVSGIATSALIR
jgi:hypothetical protein